MPVCFAYDGLCISMEYLDADGDGNAFFSRVLAATKKWEEGKEQWKLEAETVAAGDSILSMY